SRHRRCARSPRRRTRATRSSARARLLAVGARSPPQPPAPAPAVALARVAAPASATDRAGRSCCGAGKKLEQRLLRVPAVLGLVPDALAGAVEDIRRDLLARVSRQVVQREGAGRGGVEQRVVDAVALQRRAPLGGGLLVAH